MNPFQPPTEETSEFTGPTSEWYDRLSKLQRRLNLSFLGLLTCLIGWIPIGAMFDSPLRDTAGISVLFGLWGIVVFALWVTTQVHVFLVLKTTGSVTGAAFTVLFLGLPLVGSIAVMIASKRATGVLRRGGYRVGFLGLKSKAMSR